MSTEKQINQPISTTSTVCHSHEHGSDGDGQIESVAWMVVFGDAVHNFMDGITIGASFQTSLITGFSICLAVIGEELPHELGDFAALLRGGMSVKKALFYNFVSALSCYVGLIIGILVSSQVDEAIKIVLGLAGGLFLYIALVDMMPISTDTVDELLRKGEKSKAAVMFVMQTIGMFAGIFALYFLAKYDHAISIENWIDI